MKLIIAHLPNQAFEPVRNELLDLGVSRMTISEVHSSGPQSEVTLRTRGTALRTHMRPELRLECLTSAGQAAAVVAVLRAHATARRGLGGQVVVVDLEEVHEAAAGEDETFSGDPRVSAAAA